MSVALEVRNLWKSYAVGVRGCSARVSVLRGVTLHVATGERVGVLGGPGAGKTTLAHCILGLRQPEAGVVRRADPAAVALLVLDEGPDGWAPHRGGAPPTMLVLARRLESLRARVDRILLLRDGRVVPLDPPAGAHAGRRVAERRPESPPESGPEVR